MKLNCVVPTIWTTEVRETIDFYREKMGFKCSVASADWATLERDGVEFMIALPNKKVPFTGPEFTGTFYFRIEGVDEYWAQVKDKAEVVYPLEEFDSGMREFCVMDNNGYRLQFGEEIE